MLIQRAYKTEIRPTRAQKKLLWHYASAARWTYNWGLEQWRQAYRETGQGLSAYTLQKMLTVLRRTTEPWLYKIPNQVTEAAIHDLEMAYKQFFRKLKEGKSIGNAGRPRFKKQDRHVAFRARRNICLEQTGVRLYSKSIGMLQTKEQCFMRDVDCKIKNAIVSHIAGRWFISVQVEQEIKPTQATGAVIGVDRGIVEMAITSDDVRFRNPKATARYAARLRALNKKLSRQKQSSNNWKRTKEKIARVHWRIANVRRAATNAASTTIVGRHRSPEQRPSCIGIETLNVSGMIKNHRLAKSISDANFAELARQIKYKAEWSGVAITEADRFFPSSKMCSQCAHIVEKLKLNQRTFVCPKCGLKIDRDLNAAVNLKHVALDGPIHNKNCVVEGM